MSGLPRPGQACMSVQSQTVVPVVPAAPPVVPAHTLPLPAWHTPRRDLLRLQLRSHAKRDPAASCMRAYTWARGHAEVLLPDAWHCLCAPLMRRRKDMQHASHRARARACARFRAASAATRRVAPCARAAKEGRVRAPMLAQHVRLAGPARTRPPAHTQQPQPFSHPRPAEAAHRAARHAPSGSEASGLRPGSSRAHHITCPTGSARRRPWA